MCAHGVEVAQQRDVPAVVRMSKVTEDFLDKELGATIRIGSAEWVRLRDWQDFRRAVNGGGRGEDEIEAAMTAHDVKQHQG